MRDVASVSPLGTLADGVVGTGRADGRLVLDHAGIEIDWWIGADDGWIMGTEGVHTIRPGIAPAVESRVRVPGGEVVLRAYAVARPGGPEVVAEIENASPAAAVVAWVVRGAPGYRIGRVALDGSTLVIDERARVELPRAPLRWAVGARSVGVRAAVVGGNASSGAFLPVTTRRGDLEVALLFPVAHRTRTRIAATTSEGEREAIAVAQLPELADVERGWEAALDRGARVELPDEITEAAADAARATLLLTTRTGVSWARFSPPNSRRVVSVGDTAAAWGLGGGRVPRPDGRGGDGDPWPALKADRAMSGSSPARAAQWLRLLHRALVRVNRNSVDVLPWFPDEWLGRPVTVHDLPTRRGSVSFALRWHGARPALLWDVPAGMRVHAPRLDPAWEGAGGAGETLLAEIDPTRLLPLGKAVASEPGIAIEEPGSFL